MTPSCLVDTLELTPRLSASAKDGAVHLPPIAPQNGVAIFDDLDDDPECVVLSPNDDMVAVTAARCAHSQCAHCDKIRMARSAAVLQRGASSGN